MKLTLVGIIFFIYVGFLNKTTFGAFVDIGNLPATTSIHEDDNSKLVFSVSVYPTSASCNISNGDTDSNFVGDNKGNGQFQISTVASPSFDHGVTPVYTLVIECTNDTELDTGILTVNIEANANFILNNFVGNVATVSVNAKTVKSGHVIFAVSYTDVDNDPPLNNTITSTDPSPAPFDFNGDYMYATQDLLDHQVTSYTINFDATDGRNTQALKLQITITGLNTPPKITNLNNTLTLPELTPGRKLVYKINYIDNEADSIQFEIVNYEDVNGVFDIILSSGEVYLKEGFELDYETTGEYWFELTIRDEYHNTTEPNKFLTIQVTDINEAPFWPSDPDPVSVDESGPGAIVGTPFDLCDDPDGTPDTSAMRYRFLSGTYSSYFAIDQTTANVTFARDWDYDDKTLPETFSLTLQCVDPDGVLASTDFVITILDINDNDPVCYPFNSTLPLTYAQADSESITHLNCTDADSTVNAELQYSIIGASKGYGKTYFNVDATGNVTITKEFEMEYNSTFYVTVEVTDKGSPSRSTTVTLTVSYTEKPVVTNYTEITTCFLCTTGSVTLISATAFVVLLLLIFLIVLVVLGCCYLCEQSRMRNLIASEHKVKTSRICDCCRPKHRRRRRRKNAKEIAKAQRKDDEYMRAREKFKEEKIHATQESKNQYNGAALPGTVVSGDVQGTSLVRAEISHPSEESQWKKFRKAM